MRIIGGEFRSRPLKSVQGFDVRPTPDRLRQTLFDVISASVPGCTFLDAYAGTGAVGLEALSRGAAHAIFIEKSREALDALRENLANLNAAGRATVIAGSVKIYLGVQIADIIFIDPPYGATAEYGDALRCAERTRAAVVIAQHDVRTELEERYGTLVRSRQIRQGGNVLTLFHPESSPSRSA